MKCGQSSDYDLKDQAQVRLQEFFDKKHNKKKKESLKTMTPKSDINLNFSNPGSTITNFNTRENTKRKLVFSPASSV